MKRATALFGLAVCVIVGLCGCANSSESRETGSISTADSTGTTHDSKDADTLLDKVGDAYSELETAISDELDSRRNSTPVHASIGEEVAVTDNLAVSVVAVENGPYDYADRTPTVKVTVQMRNLTDRTLRVKPSNFDADNSNGERVDHKIHIKDENGNRDTRSFAPTSISPNSTFTGEVYFDGESLVSVVYEPHWLVSSQNQYVYFDMD